MPVHCSKMSSYIGLNVDGQDTPLIPKIPKPTTLEEKIDYLVMRQETIYTFVSVTFYVVLFILFLILLASVVIVIKIK